MAQTQSIKSVCTACRMSCGIEVTLEDGRPIKILPDPDDPMSKMMFCKKASLPLDYFNNPERLKYPLKREGKRGEGKWKQISWDEALDTAGEAFEKTKQDHGPESVVMIHGGAKGYMDPHLLRLAHAFGTPNVMSADHACHIPRMVAAELTLGFHPRGDFQHGPACIVLWGVNSDETMEIMSKPIRTAQDNGAKLLVINPLKTDLADRADLWLRIRPGSDAALALCMLNIIINEDLYDKDFVAHWTVGFDKLREHVQEYTPERVSEITWLSKEQILEATRLYAQTKPACIQSGNAFDATLNNFQGGRALFILSAVTGNIGVPGGELETPGSGFLSADPWRPSYGIHARYSSILELRDKLTEADREKRVGAELNMLTDFRYISPRAFRRSILQGEPYPIRAAFVQGSNPLTTWGNGRDTRAAFENVEFSAVSELFMTPTAMTADIVFPSAPPFEYEGVLAAMTGDKAIFHPKVAQLGECRSPHDILIGLGQRLGLTEYLGEKSDDFWDTVLEPAGLTFEEFKSQGNILPDMSKPPEYKKYEKNGFDTPSGKVEIYSEQVEKQGFDPLPVYCECLETAESAQEGVAEYPLIATGQKVRAFEHSTGRQIPSQRKSRPDPLVIIHPETAGDLGIKDSDWVFIENRQGRIRLKATLSDAVDPRVIVADQNWWFPEKKEAELFGCFESNYNLLVDDNDRFSREIGSFNIRGVRCKVYKAE